MKGIGIENMRLQRNIVDLFPGSPADPDRWMLYGEWTYTYTHTRTVRVIIYFNEMPHPTLNRADDIGWSAPFTFLRSNVKYDTLFFYKNQIIFAQSRCSYFYAQSEFQNVFILFLNLISRSHCYCYFGLWRL